MSKTGFVVMVVFCAICAGAAWVYRGVYDSKKQISFFTEAEKEVGKVLVGLTKDCEDTIHHIRKKDVWARDEALKRAQARMRELGGWMGRMEKESDKGKQSPPDATPGKPSPPPPPGS